MLKIGIISLNGYNNYGNIFQRYALRNYIEKFNVEVDTLWHDADNFLPRTWKWDMKKYIKYILNWEGFRNEMSSSFYWEIIRQSRIRMFSQRNVPLKRIERDIKIINNQYDYFIVGSDQVWNPMRCDISANDFLNFATASKRIAYAASFGVSSLPEQSVKKFKSWLEDMNTISVREQAGAKIVKELIGKKVSVHVDPTLLLEADAWAELEEVPAWYDGKPYICTYFLGERPAAVDEIAVKSGLPIINILDKDVFDHYITSPEEFLWLIHHASLVYTDSFHGTVFSILFERPFVVCDRLEAGACNMSSRINTLLRIFRLENRYANAENNYHILDPFKMDYPDLAPIFARERQRSYDYLACALGVNG